MHAHAHANSDSCSACSVTRLLALDCEMVGTGPDGAKSALARVVLVNSFGNAVLDSYVRPTLPVTDFRTAVSGIRPHHLEARGAPCARARARGSCAACASLHTRRRREP